MTVVLTMPPSRACERGRQQLAAHARARANMNTVHQVTTGFVRVAFGRSQHRLGP